MWSSFPMTVNEMGELFIEDTSAMSKRQHERKFCTVYSEMCEANFYTSL